MDDFCRICLKYDASLCFIDDLKWSMLRLSLPGLDLKLISEPKLCNRCFQIINNSYKFLVMAITNEINVQEKFNKTLSKVNLTTFQESTSSAFPVCRLCLRNTTNKVINLYKNEIIHQSLEMIRKMIDSCIGHMNFDITNEPVMCDSCWALLQITCNLRKFCSEIEKRLSIYCRDGKLICHIKQIINNSSTIDELVNNFYIEPNIDRYIQNFEQGKLKQNIQTKMQIESNRPKIDGIINNVINKTKRTQINSKKVNDKKSSELAKSSTNSSSRVRKNQISSVNKQNDSNPNKIGILKINSNTTVNILSAKVSTVDTKLKVQGGIDNTSISKQNETIIQETEIKQEIEEISNSKNKPKSVINICQNKVVPTERGTLKNLRSNNRVVSAQLEPEDPKSSRKQKTVQIASPQKLQREIISKTPQTDTIIQEENKLVTLRSTSKKKIDSSSQSPKKTQINITDGQISSTLLQNKVTDGAKDTITKIAQNQKKSPSTKKQTVQQQNTQEQEQSENFLNLRHRTVHIHENPKTPQKDNRIEETEIKQEIEETSCTNAEYDDARCNTRLQMNQLRKNSENIPQTADKAKRISQINNDVSSSGINKQSQEKSCSKTSKTPDVKVEEKTNSNKGSSQDKVVEKVKSFGCDSQIETTQIAVCTKSRQKEKSQKAATPQKQHKDLINSDDYTISPTEHEPRIPTKVQKNLINCQIEAVAQTKLKKVEKIKLRQKNSGANAKTQQKVETQNINSPPVAKASQKQKENSNIINYEKESESESVMDLKSGTIPTDVCSKTPQKGSRKKKVVKETNVEIIEQRNNDLVTTLQNKQGKNLKNHQNEENLTKQINSKNVVTISSQKRNLHRIAKDKNVSITQKENESKNVVENKQNNSESDKLSQSSEKEQNLNLTNEETNVDSIRQKLMENEELINVNKRKSDSDTNLSSNKQKKLKQTSLESFLLAAKQKGKQSLKQKKQHTAKNTIQDPTIDTSVTTKFRPSNSTSKNSDASSQEESKSPSCNLAEKSKIASTTPESIKEERVSVNKPSSASSENRIIDEITANSSRVKSETESEDDTFEDEIAQNNISKRGGEKNTLSSLVSELDSDDESLDESESSYEDKKVSRKKRATRKALSQDNSDDLLLPGGFQCPRCPHRARSKINLRKHLVLHETNDGTEIFECGVCAYKTTSRHHYQRHMIIHDSESKTFDCFHCSYKATKKQYLIYHMLVHRTAEAVTLFNCPLCPYKTKRKTVLKNHIELHKVKLDSSLQCKLCSYKAARKSYLVSHMLVHKTEYVYKCTECDYKARRKTHLDSHLLKHKNVTFFECYHCGYKAKRKSHLVTHLTIHTGVKAFQCDLCSYQGKRKSHLISHYESHKNKKKKEDAEEDDGGRKYECAQCSHTSFNRRLFLRHLIRHKSENMKKSKISECSSVSSS